MKQEKKRKWCGHLPRMQQHRLQIVALYCKAGIRNVGNPGKNWILELVQSKSLEMEKAKRKLLKFILCYLRTQTF